MILESVIENLEAQGLLQTVPRTHLVLGYSGGADSTALLFLLNDMKQKLPLDVTAVYFNHRWRANPPEELPLVHQNCLETNTPLVIVQADLTIAKTESEARHARYRQLTRLAHDLHADAVLTAHHADDQVETLLFRILRGTGIDGLSGIHKRLVLEADTGSPVPVLRPLLDISRKNLREYIQEKGLRYFDDPTNLDSKRQRNNIRHNVLPVLENAFPQVKNSLFRLTLVADGDLSIIDDAVQGIWREVYGADKAGPYLEAIRFNQLGLPYQRRVLKRFLARQEIHLDFQSIEDLLGFIRGEGRKNLDASLRSMVKGKNGKTRYMALYKNRLRLIDAPDQTVEPSFAAPVAIPGPVELKELDCSFFALPWYEPEKIKVSPIRPNDSQQVYVDLSAFIDKPLEFRTRRPGDKFQPMGMEAPLRLKKFLINRGVPRFERNRMPVLAHGNQVLWVPGLGISQQLRIKDKAVPSHLLRMLAGINHPAPPPPPEPVEEVERPERPSRAEMAEIAEMASSADAVDEVDEEESSPFSEEVPTGVEP